MTASVAAANCMRSSVVRALVAKREPKKNILQTSLSGGSGFLLCEQLAANALVRFKYEKCTLSICIIIVSN